MYSQIPTQTIQFADWTHTMQRSVLRQMVAVAAQPGVLSFAGGLPDPALFPRADYAAALAAVLAAEELALQYRPPYAPLKEQIVQLMAQRGVDCTPEQVFLTTGAQQGLDVLTRMLLNPGGQVLLEEIVYTGAQQAISPYQPEILTVPTDLATGIDVDAIEQHLLAGARPAFLYVIPTAHNPLGVSISQEKRERLVQLARQYGIPIIEDDPYGFLQYDREQTPPRPLRALDDEFVFYLGSFSKIMAPALRLGWMIVPEELVLKLTVVKEIGDLESSALTQRAVATYLQAGHLPAHLSQLRTTYGRRRDAMLAGLQRYFPAEARWTVPDGGMFIWVELPKTADTAALLPVAIDTEQVAFIPGHAFALPGIAARHCLRLNFTNCTVADIEDGLRRLGRLVHDIL